MDFEDIIQRIIEGDTYRSIALHYKVALTTLFDFLHTPEHSARAREALNLSADTAADKAEDVLKEAKGTMPEIMRAKELSQYYKWKASKRRPATYGDKVDLNHSGDVTIRKVEVEIFKTKDGTTDNQAQGK